MLGADHFVQCLHHPDHPDEVVVINIETGWAPSFYRMCQQNPGNPYLPRIFDVKEKDGFCVVRMEKLVALDHDGLSEGDRAMLAENARQIIEGVTGGGAGMTAEGRAAFARILTCAGDIYRCSAGETFPFFYKKPENVFGRRLPDGSLHPVMGDLMFPGGRLKSANDLTLLDMNDMRRAFGVEAIEFIKSRIFSRNEPQPAGG